MKKIFLFFWLFPMGVSANTQNCATMRHVPNKEISLQEIIELGLCRNPQTASAYMSLKAAEYTKKTSYSYYLPSVTGHFNSKRNHTEHDDWDYGVSLSVSYLIFDFGKRESDFAQSLAVYRAAGFDYDEKIQNYIFSLVASYYELLKSDADVKSAVSALTVAKTAKNIADKKYKSGVVAKADVYRADTTLASSQLSLERAKNNREIAKATLLNAISFPSDDEIKIKDMPISFGSDTESEEVEKLINIARKQRPDLLKAVAQTNAAWHKRNSSFLKNLPSLSVNGILNNNAKTADGMFAHITDKTSGQIGFSVSMPLFAGFSNLYTARSENADYESMKYNEKQIINSASMDVFTAYQNYKTAKTVLVQSESLLKSAVETERVTSGMYKVGRSTMLDWQTAQSELVDAQKQNNYAKYDLFVKRASVALAIGEIKLGLKNKERK